MVRINVIWTETAIKQRRGIFTFWNNRNSSTRNSNRIRILINERIELISQNPTSFLKSKYTETYVTFIEHFCLYYRIVPEGLLVTAFWDCRQDPDKLLEILLRYLIRKS